MNPESVIGITSYLTKIQGVGGRLKKSPEDFVVDELSIMPEEVEGGRFTAAVVRSRNWETNRLVRRIARNLKVSRKRIYFAGTKDKRAVTTQLFVFAAPVEDVKSLRIPDVDVIEAYETNKRIRFGDLRGNEFRIAIRDIEFPVEEVARIVDSTKDAILARGGFPNYFGVQRFGAVRPITHLVGKYLIRGEFEKAVRTYIANPIEGEDEKEFNARKALDESGDYAAALQTYPKGLSFEKAMLNHLVNNEDDFIGALRELPENLLSMFVHSYQSYLFNRILSSRMEKGLPINEPLPGDLILPLDKLGLPDSLRYIDAESSNLEKLTKRCREGKAFVSGLLFGSEVRIAEGEMGEIERKIVEDEGLKPNDFIIPKMPKLSSRGIRRGLLAPLEKMDIDVSEDVAVLRFQLAKGCYATSLLREFMKSERLVNY
jgi:tRNA pseudouridine13 synthase